MSGRNHFITVFKKFFDISLGSGMTVHIAVHCRENKDFTSICQYKRRKQIIGKTVRQSSYGLRRGRCDDNQVVFSGQIYMVHALAFFVQEFFPYT